MFRLIVVLGLAFLSVDSIGTSQKTNGNKVRTSQINWRKSPMGFVF